MEVYNIRAKSLNEALDKLSKTFKEKSGIGATSVTCWNGTRIRIDANKPLPKKLYPGLVKKLTRKERQILLAISADPINFDAGHSVISIRRLGSYALIEWGKWGYDLTPTGLGICKLLVKEKNA
jgi:hypothetical protein